MSDPHETLARIRNQAAAASEGPWMGISYPDGFLGRVIGGNGFTVAEDFGQDADAEFIAASRTTVPALLDALEAVLKVHRDGGESQGYLDNGHYGVIDHCCTECGSYGEYGTPWPCPTVQAITTTLEGETND